MSENYTMIGENDRASEPKLDGTGVRRWPLRRNYWLEEVAKLDPVYNAHCIHRITAAIEFPWDYQRALEFALFRTYSVPSIADVLESSGEFRLRPQKRYDDTTLLMAELLEYGPASECGRDSLRVINRNHSRYAITNDDMRYVLSTFIFEPIEWIDNYGWRRLHPKERLAAFCFYLQVGKRMGIRELPATMSEYREWRDAYEAANIRCTENTRKVAGYTLNLMTSWYPAPLRPAVRLAVYALVEPQMQRAFGYPVVPERVRTAVRTTLRMRSAVVGALPPRCQALRVVDGNYRTYPDYSKSQSLTGRGVCPHPAH